MKRSPARRDEPGFAARLLGYFTSRAFWLTLLGIALASIVLFMAVNAGLSWYTNHGQRLEVGDYQGMRLQEASAQIENADFRVAISDSVFLVDEQPGIVLRQSPEPGAFVKENRRIYLTVTKVIPDEVTLPPLTGTYDFDRYRRKLTMLDIEGEVRSTEYSSQYQPNTILKVFYGNREVSETELKRGFKVPKGATLGFTVTSRAGGLATVPDLMCRTVDEARLFVDSGRLRVGRVRADAGVSNTEVAYIYRQDPPAGTRVAFDEEVHLYVMGATPPNCDEL